MRFNFFSPWTILVILVVTAFCLMLGPTKDDSLTRDELAYIPTGYSYIKYLDSRLNPEHPPLAKMLAGLPLLFKDLEFPIDQPAWITGINEYQTIGTQFLYESGNNADEIIFLARLAPIILTLLLIVFVYVFALELIGRWWALLPALFIALSPNILAHGHYVTTDIGAALGILLSTYFFLKYLFRPITKHLILAGLTFGVALLMKFSAALLIPYFLIVTTVFCLAKLNILKLKFFQYLLVMLAIFGIGFLLVYVFYFAITWNYPIEKQLTDTQHTLQSFGFRPLADLNVWMAKSATLRPLAQYLLGFLASIEHSVSGGITYFLGQVSPAGWWYYFPIVFLMKEPLAILIIIALALLFSSLNVIKSLKLTAGKALEKFKEYLSTNFIEFSMLVFIILYLGFVQNSANIGFQQIIPALPFIYILSACAIKKWVMLKPHTMAVNFLEKLLNTLRRLFGMGAKLGFISLLILWLILGAFINSPYFLSYSNEMLGGTNNGYKYVVNSNFDWGQDLKRLKIWADLNLEPDEKIAIDYFGGGNIKYYLGDRAINWQSNMGNPKEEGIEWLAVSVTTLQNAIGQPHPKFIRNHMDEYRWLENPLSPTDQAGTSMFIYRLN